MAVVSFDIQLSSLAATKYPEIIGFVCLFTQTDLTDLANMACVCLIRLGVAESRFFVMLITTSLPGHAYPQWCWVGNREFCKCAKNHSTWFGVRVTAIARA